MQLGECKKNFQDELRSLGNKDPKAYWNLIKTSSVKVKNELQNVNLQAFNYVTNNEGYVDIDAVISSANNDFINAPFTGEDVLKATRNLKNNKACSSDLIINTFLKASTPKLLSVFTTLFNLVLESVSTPKSWTCGFIKPI